MTGKEPATGTLTATAPTATTEAVSNVMPTSATLHGMVNPQGAATSVTFTYGTDPALVAGTAAVVLSLLLAAWGLSVLFDRHVERGGGKRPPEPA